MTEEGTVVFEFPSNESMVVNMVRAVSEYKAVDSAELSPLNEAIDPDAFERFLRNSETSIHVTFRYEGLDITVRSGNRISISESVADA